MTRSGSDHLDDDATPTSRRSGDSCRATHRRPSMRRVLRHPIAAVREDHRLRYPAGLLRILHQYRAGIWLWVVGIYLLGFNGDWLITPDSTQAAWTGRRLAEGGGYDWPWPEPVPYQPGLPLLFAGSFALFGQDVFWPAIAVVWVMGLATVLLAARLFQLALGPAFAAAGLLMVGVSGKLHESAFHLLTDTPFVFGLMIMLLGFEWFGSHRAPLASRPMGRNALSLMLIVLGFGLMALFRTVALTAAVAVAVSLIVWLWRAYRQRGAGVGRLLAGLAGIFAASAGVVWLLRSNPDVRYVLNRLAQWDQVLAQTMQVRLPSLLGVHLPDALLGHELSVLALGASLLALVGVVCLFHRRVLWGCLVVAFMVQIACFVVQGRYFLPIVPLLAAGWVLAALALGDRVRRWLPAPAGAAVSICLVLIWVISNGMAQVDTVMKQRTDSHFGHERQPVFKAALDAWPSLRELPSNQLILSGFRDRGFLGYATHGASLEARLDWNNWHRVKRKIVRDRLDHVYYATPRDNDLTMFLRRLDLASPPQTVIQTPGLQVHRSPLPVYDESDAEDLFVGLLGTGPQNARHDRLVDRLLRREMFRPELAATLVHDGRFHHGPGTILSLAILADSPLDGETWPAVVRASTTSDGLIDRLAFPTAVGDDPTATPPGPAKATREHGLNSALPTFNLYACIDGLKASGAIVEAEAQRLRTLAEREPRRVKIEVIRSVRGPWWQSHQRAVRLQALALALRGRALSEVDTSRWEARPDDEQRLFDAAAAFLHEVREDAGR